MQWWKSGIWRRLLLKGLMLETEQEPGSSGYTTDGDGLLSSRVDRENDVGREIKHSIICGSI